MKKFVIIVLVFAALVFGSCGELQKGGKIRVTNENTTLSVDIYITESPREHLLTPPEDHIVKKNINPNTTGEISINKDGTYYVNPFYNIGDTPVLGTAEPFLGAAILLAGNTVSVKVNFIGQ